MYESFYGLNEKPFSLNPDPGFLYLGSGHSRALAMLEYGIAQETGVVVITGEVGSGKTTLLRYLLNQLDDNYSVGMITNTHSSFGELIHWISSAFGLSHEGRDKVALYNQFVEFMIGEYAAGRRVLVIVDEAQNMSAETLEELRVISNINADKDIVMQLVLVGQPELRDTLAQPKLRQFVQRISAFYYLKPLELEDVTRYLEHRLRHAGCDRKVFDYKAIYLIHEHSAGVPRIINTLCNLALTYAFAAESPRVTEAIMREVVEDRAEHGLFGVEHLTLGERVSADGRVASGPGADGEGAKAVASAEATEPDGASESGAADENLADTVDLASTLARIEASSAFAEAAEVAQAEVEAEPEAEAPLAGEETSPAPAPALEAESEAPAQPSEAVDTAGTQAGETSTDAEPEAPLTIDKLFGAATNRGERAASTSPADVLVNEQEILTAIERESAALASAVEEDLGRVAAQGMLADVPAVSVDPLPKAVASVLEDPAALAPAPAPATDTATGDSAAGDKAEPAKSAGIPLVPKAAPAPTPAAPEDVSAPRVVPRVVLMKDTDEVPARKGLMGRLRGMFSRD